MLLHLSDYPDKQQQQQQQQQKEVTESNLHLNDYLRQG